MNASDDHDQQIKDVAEAVKRAKCVLLAGHPQMDGDALGSALAFYNALGAQGVECTVVTQDVGAGKFAYLTGADQLRSLDDMPEIIDGYDTAIICDVGAESRARRVLERLAPSTHVINVDHHIDNPHFGNSSVVLPRASSTGEVAYKILKAANIPLNLAAAECIYTAIATDTGRFMYANTTPFCMRVVADLMEEFGLNINRLTANIWRSKSEGRLHLEGLVAQTLETRLDGRLTLARVTQDMLQQTGCTDADASEMVTIPKAVKGSMVCVLFRESSDDDMRVSFRSEGQLAVNEIAAQFNGGGHLRAAGCHMKGRPVAEMQSEIADVVQAALAEAISNGARVVV